MRELETSKKCEKGMVGVSAAHKQGMMGRKMGERPFSSLPRTPFTPTFVNN